MGGKDGGSRWGEERDIVMLSRVWGCINVVQNEGGEGVLALKRAAIRIRIRAGPRGDWRPQPLSLRSL